MEVTLLSESLLFWAVVSVVFYTVYGMVDPLYLSPVSSFPGPKLAAVTFWYEFYHDIIHRGQYLWRIQEMHKQYGPIIRINPYEIHINDPEFFEVVYSNEKKADKWEWGTKQFVTSTAMITAVDHDTNRMRRSVLNGFFSMQRARVLQPVVQERVDALVARFTEYKDSGKIMQLGNAFAAFTNDVVMEYSFSRHFHRIEAPDFDPTWLEQNHAGATRLPLFRHFHFILDVLRSLPRSVVQRMNPGLKGIVLLRRGMVEQIEVIRSGHDTSHASSSHSTIFHDILSSKLPEHEKTTDRLADEAHSLIAAGTETTSWILTVATFYLLSNPQRRKMHKHHLPISPPSSKDTPDSYNTQTHTHSSSHHPKSSNQPPLNFQPEHATSLALRRD